MRESVIENTLVKNIYAIGGECWKFTSPGHRGVPDRIIFLPGNVIVFVETKRPGEKERKQQIRVQDKMRAMGCIVFRRIDTKERVEQVVQWCRMIVGGGENEV